MIRVLALAGVVWQEMVRRKDIYVLFILIAGLMVGALGLDLFGMGGVSGYVKDAGLFASWVLGWVLAVNTAVRQLPQEESRGTIFVLLAKPVSRWEVVTGKWLGAWLVVSAAVGCFYLAVWGVVLAKGGRFELLSLAQAFLLHAVALALVIAIGIAFTTRMNGDAAAALTYTVTGAAFLIMPRLPAVLIEAEGWAGVSLGVLYYLLPHFELFDLRHRLVHGWGAVSMGVFAEILLYGFLMTALALALAWLGYRHRRFSRGNLL